ncbi:dna-(apurinic or apyrimidinic site) lyase 2 [Moniliophthora roreri]|nr:dna-(apurinic or apyrimidinic site) lyase 2 [Moniliophthora roreri]
MRILTWNINGIRTIPQYHPWNGLKSHNEILDHLGADIINFQEVKSTRPALPRSVAVPPSYDAFFSFPIQKSGYSGVATYTRSSTVTPLKAEEGLSYLFCSSRQLKPPLTSSERVSSPECYPDSRVAIVPGDAELSDDEQERHTTGKLLLSTELKSLDSEGRVLTLDFGMFVLINVYCPNDGSEERLPFKNDFHRVLETRIRALIEQERREVILVGDLNACAAMIDHCEGQIIVKRGIAEGKDGEEWFWEEKEGRQWLRDMLIWEEGSGRKVEGRGCLVDVVRKFHPDRKGMYTCWNTKLSARDSNYGTRIDYILVTPNLVPWVKDADIQPQVKGSDHCPVYIDLYDEIMGQDSKILQLKDVLSSGGDTPRIAAKFWDEHSGKQKLLSSFFAGSGQKAAPSVTSGSQCNLSTSAAPKPVNGASKAITTMPPSSPSASTSTSITITTNTTKTITSNDNINANTNSSLSKKRSRSPSSSTDMKKSKTSMKTSRQRTPSPPPSNKVTKKLKSGQSKLSTFFTQPSPSSDAPARADKRKAKQEPSGFSKASDGAANDPSGRQSIGKGKGKSKAPLTVEPIDVDRLSRDEDGGAEDVEMASGDTKPPDSTQIDDEDYRLALELSLSSDQTSASPSSSQRSAGEAWKTLMAPIQPPRCTFHDEPAKEFTVNKPGVNKGKKFFVCSRPVGPGYDMGRGERLREDVNPEFRCNFFKWSSDLSLAIALTLFAVYFVYKKARRSVISTLPGPPPRSFLLGNLEDVMQNDAGLTDFDWQDNYGGVVHFKGVLGSDRLLVSDPKALQHILQTTAYKWRKWSERRQISRLTSGYGLLWSDGETHKRHRKVMLPGFGTPEAKSYLPLFLSCASSVTTRWRDMLSTESSATVDVPFWISRATLDAIGLAAFDYQFGAMNNDDNELSKAYQQLVPNALALPSRTALFLMDIASFVPDRTLDWLTDYGWGRRFEAMRHATEVSSNISKRMLDEKKEHAAQGVSRKDIMSLLVKANASENPKAQLSEVEMISQMRAENPSNIILAGHETTSTTLGWTLMELAKNPKIQDRLRKEIRATERIVLERGDADFTIKDLDGLPYLGAVVKEALRMHPVVLHVFREANEDDILPLSTPLTTSTGKVMTELPLPKGTRIMVELNLRIRNKEIFGKDAHDFNPERWLEPGCVKKSVSIGVYANLASFSAGVRSCIGWRFAVTELHAFLVELVSNFEFSPTPKFNQIRRKPCLAVLPFVEGELEKGSQLPLEIKIASRE